MLRSTAKLLFQGAIESYDFSTYEINGFRVHDITVTGPINLATRLPLYRETLKHSIQPYYFCTVDNMAGYENTFTFEDIQVLDQILADSGIRLFYGATITNDEAYAKVTKLAQEHMSGVGLNGMVVTVPDRASADAFIFEKLEEAAAAGNHISR